MGGKSDVLCPGVSLSESNAIAQYLVEHYDKENRLTFTTTPEKYLVNQWLLFQGAVSDSILQKNLSPAVHAFLRQMVLSVQYLTFL